MRNNGTEAPRGSISDFLIHSQEALRQKIRDARSLRNLALAGMIASTGEFAVNSNNADAPVFIASAALFILAAAGLEVRSTFFNS